MPEKAKLSVKAKFSAKVKEPYANVCDFYEFIVEETSRGVYFAEYKMCTSTKKEIVERVKFYSYLKALEFLREQFMLREQIFILG